MTFSDYIVFADESGDHGLISIDPEFPVFALVFCAFEREAYVTIVEPAFRRLKFKWFGHDAVVLHEREIRKQEPPFSFLRDAAARESFMEDVNAIMRDAPFRAFVAVIDKVRLRDRYARPWNPYEIAMLFCMERLSGHLASNRQNGRLAHVLFEGRGKQEDAQLELEFRRIVNNERRWGYKAIDFGRCPLQAVFVPKAANLGGHQLTDLIARPLALSVLRPNQRNRAAETIRDRVVGWKLFP